MGEVKKYKPGKSRRTTVKEVSSVYGSVPESSVVIYKTADHETQVEVRFDEETVWLTIDDMVKLFEKSRATINEHILNIFREKELSEEDVMKKIGISDFSTKPTNFYNLDVIISVGYRVKSKRGTQFRQWASQRLKEYLVKGYTINQKRLDELGKIVQLIELSGKTDNLQLQEVKGLLEILSNYTRSFVLLNQYDRRHLQPGRLSDHITYEIQYDEAKTAIAELKNQLMSQKEATLLFGIEKNGSFKSSLQTVVQAYAGRYLYPSIEEQAAHLLYFVIKNHSFTDGNKRIGAFYLCGFWRETNTGLNQMVS